MERSKMMMAAMGVLTTAAVVAGGSILLMQDTPAQADGPSLAQVAKQVNSAPANGTKRLPWGAVGSLRGAHAMVIPPVTRGNLEIVAGTYKITTGMKSSDEYLLEVDITNSNSGGNIPAPGAQVAVTEESPSHVVSYSDTQSFSSSSNSCSTITVGVGLNWGPLSFGASYNANILCQKNATVSHSQSGATGTWAFSNLARTKSAALQRVVKVKKGVRPVFVVTVVTPKTGACVRKLVREWT